MDLLLTQEPASLYGGIEAAAATLQRAFFENKSQPEVLGRLVEESSKTVDEIILGQARKATRPFVFWDEEGRQVGASEVASGHICLGNFGQAAVDENRRRKHLVN